MTFLAGEELLVIFTHVLGVVTFELVSFFALLDRMKVVKNLLLVFVFSDVTWKLAKGAEHGGFGRAFPHSFQGGHR